MSSRGVAPPIDAELRSIDQRGVRPPTTHNERITKNTRSAAVRLDRR